MVRKEQLDRIDNNAAIAAARRFKELSGRSKGGKKTARSRKEERGEDEARKAILDEAQEEIKKRNELYPNEKDRPQDKSDTAIYRHVSERHKGNNEKPIMSAGAIKKALQRRKDETRGKYNRVGKKRGKYKRVNSRMFCV